MKYLIYSSIFLLTHIGSFGIGYAICSRFGYAAKKLKRYERDNKPATDLDNIFEEALGQIKLTDEEILQIGTNKKPKTPIGGLTISSGGGYITNEQLENQAENADACRLTREEHDTLTEWWKDKITNLKFDKDEEIAELKGYTLHIMQINKGRRLLSRIYDPTIISVRIEDTDYNFALKRPSKQAIIKQVIGISGQN